MQPQLVYHFSEDSNIKLFTPHVPQSRNDVKPLVWAIDEAHAPLYWFPRDCPRLTFWAGPETPSETIQRFFAQTSAKRIHAIECSWLEPMRTSTALCVSVRWRSLRALG
jgi:hypothetical protein